MNLLLITPRLITVLINACPLSRIKEVAEVVGLLLPLQLLNLPSVKIMVEPK